MIAFIHAHSGILSLFGLAFVATMPDELPEGWADIPDWLYGWIHGGLKTFISIRGPKP